MNRLLLALLLVAVASFGCYDSNETSPTSPEIVGALSLSATAATAPADGFTTIELIAQIDPRADPDKRTITFTSTAGTLVGAAAATSTSKSTLAVTADSAGSAHAFLQAPAGPQTAIVEATVSNAAPAVVRRLEISFFSAAPSDVIRLSTSSNTAPADGASTVQVIADIAAALPAGQRTVTFSTTFGTFLPSNGTTATATADASNRVAVDLKSPTTLGDARITATVGSASSGVASALAVVNYVRAMPDAIQVTLGQPNLPANGTVLVTATLLRNIGTVTANTAVTFSAVDANTGAALDLVFSSITFSNASGVATATVGNGPNTPAGTVATIRVRADNGVTGTANLVIGPLP